MSHIFVKNRRIGLGEPPLVIAEIGINHEGNLDKAIALIDGAKKAGCECVKFQYHIVEEEMIPNNIIPGNAKESIWKIIKRCALTHQEEVRLKKYVSDLDLIYLSTPFSREAANRLGDMGVDWIKIGSGECNNYPLIEHVARIGKPILLSTGMNDIETIAPAVNIIRAHGRPYGLFHCTSLYPTPYPRVRLGALKEMSLAFPDAVLGLSDHSIGIYTALAAVPLGVSLIEKHFTVDKSWPGPDVPISLDLNEMSELVRGSRAVFEALGGRKEILREEEPTINFAYASVVSIKPILKGDLLTLENVWVKRPGTGEIKAKEFNGLLGRRAVTDIPNNTPLKWSDLSGEAESLNDKQ